LRPIGYKGQVTNVGRIDTTGMIAFGELSTGEDGDLVSGKANVAEGPNPVIDGEFYDINVAACDQGSTTAAAITSPGRIVPNVHRAMIISRSQPYRAATGCHVRVAKNDAFS
jgi:hypothetical protein